MTNTYDTSKHILATLIEITSYHPYKVADSEFTEILEAYNMSEEVVMDMMIRMPDQCGSFSRVVDGFIFFENDFESHLDDEPLDFFSKNKKDLVDSN